MTLSVEAQPVPLSTDPGGVVRVSGTRVTLESVIHAFKEGASAEQIVQSFDTLSLGDVYAVIAYYLKHTAEVDAYLRESEEQFARLRDESRRRPEMQGIRERLLARKSRQP